MKHIKIMIQTAILRRIEREYKRAEKRGQWWKAGAKRAEYNRIMYGKEAA